MNVTNKRKLEQWSPWILLLAVILLWQIICSAFNVSEFIFPSPLRIWNQIDRSSAGDHRGPRLANLLGDDGGLRDWRSWWACCSARPDRRVLAPGLCGGLSADDGVQCAAQGGVRAHPRRVVRDRQPAGHPHRVPHLLLPDHGEYCNRAGHAGAGTGRRAAGAGRPARTGCPDPKVGLGHAPCRTSTGRSRLPSHAWPLSAPRCRK